MKIVDFGYTKAPNCNFNTKSVFNQRGFSNSAVSWGPKNRTNRGFPVLLHILQLLTSYENISHFFFYAILIKKTTFTITIEIDIDIHALHLYLEIAIYVPNYRIFSYKTRGNYFFEGSSTAGIIRTRVSVKGCYYYQNLTDLETEPRNPSVFIVKIIIGVIKTKQ